MLGFNIMLEKITNAISAACMSLFSIYLIVANIVGLLTYATVTYQLFQHRDYIGCIVWVLFVGHIISIVNGIFWPLGLYLGLGIN